MTQTVSLVHVNISPIINCVSPMLVYCFGWRDTTDSTTSPDELSASYLVFKFLKIFCCWQFGWVTVQRVLSWFWLNLENSLTLWREFERSQSSKNQYGSSIPRWIALWMYHGEHNQWYQWKWQLRKLHSMVNNPVIAWYKQNILDRWQMARNSRGARARYQLTRVRGRARLYCQNPSDISWIHHPARLPEPTTAPARGGLRPSLYVDWPQKIMPKNHG